MMESGSNSGSLCPIPKGFIRGVPDNPYITSFSVLKIKLTVIIG